jgi:hypothetical protein
MSQPCPLLYKKVFGPVLRIRGFGSFFSLSFGFLSLHAAIASVDSPSWLHFKPLRRHCERPF